MGNVRELYIREHYVIREIRENFVSRKFPSTRYIPGIFTGTGQKMADVTFPRKMGKLTNASAAKNRSQGGAMI